MKRSDIHGKSSPIKKKESEEELKKPQQQRLQLPEDTSLVNPSAKTRASEGDPISQVTNNVKESSHLIDSGALSMKRNETKEDEVLADSLNMTSSLPYHKRVTMKESAGVPNMKDFMKRNEQLEIAFVKLHDIIKKNRENFLAFCSKKVGFFRIEITEFVF